MIGLAIVALLLIITVAAVMVTIGVLVSRDAKKRGLDPMKWTLIALLAPAGIGIIIYLIKASERPVRKCDSCGKGVSTEFVVCPHCGAKLKERCDNCNYPIESGWSICPNCAEPITDEKRAAAAQQQHSSRGVGWVIATIVFVPVLIFALMVSMLAVYASRIESAAVASVSSVAASDTVCGDYINEWMRQCDTSGEGIYMLTERLGYDGDYCSCCIAYCNIPGTEPVNWLEDEGGIFRNPRRSIIYSSGGSSAGNTDGAYSFYISRSSRDMSYDARDTHGNILSVIETDANGALEPLICSSIGGQLNTEELPAADKVTVMVYIDESVDDVYSLGWSLYDESGKITCSGGCCNADEGSRLKGICTAEFVKGLNADSVSSIVIDACDSEGNVLFTSENISCEFGDTVKLELVCDESGSLKLR